MKRLFLAFFVLLVFVSCQQPAGDVYVTNTVNIVWQGSFDYPPANPKVGWDYYVTTNRMSFVWD